MTKTGKNGEALVQKGVWIQEETWWKLKQMAASNKKSITEALTEIINGKQVVENKPDKFYGGIMIELIKNIIAVVSSLALLGLITYGFHGVLTFFDAFAKRENATSEEDMAGL